jgi:general secretion pathway protein G
MNKEEKKCDKQKKSINKGLTLVELLVTIAIIGIISTIAINQTQKYIRETKVRAAIQEIRNIQKDIYLYEKRNGEWPNDLSQIYENEVPTDPWNETYVYYTIDSVTVGDVRKDRNMVPVNTDFDLYSKGVDGRSKKPFTSPFSQDDIVRANNGGFVGLVKNY